jgi:predicted phage-related endonuclease
MKTEIAAKLFLLNAQIKEMEAQASELKDLLKAIGSFTEEGYSVTVRTSDRTAVDTKVLKDKYPTIARECSKTSSVVSVIVKKV